MPHRIVLAVVAVCFTVCCTVLPCRAERILVPVKTTDYTFAVWSDPHYQITFPNRCSGVLDFIGEYEPKPEFLMVTGDMAASGTYYADGDSVDYIWISMQTLTTWSDSVDIALVPVFGNHEPSYEFDDDELDAFYSLDYPMVPDSARHIPGKVWDPYRVARKAWRNYFPPGRDYYAKEFHSLSVLAMSNNVDTLYNSPSNSNVFNSYPRSNPPGVLDRCDVDDTDCYARLLAWNTDHSGFVTPDSPQWTWATSYLDSSPSIWNVAGFHRHVYAPYGPSSHPAPAHTLHVQRPNLFSARWGIVPDMIDRGVRLFFQGDVHQGAVVGPVYQESVNSEGAYFVTTHAPFVIRQVSADYVPAGSLLYPDPVPESGQTGAHFAVCHVFGKRIYLTLYHIADCNDPAPVLVFSKGVRL